MFDTPICKTVYPVKPIGDGCEFISGYAFKGKDFIDSGNPVIKIKNIQNGKVTTDGSQFVSDDVVIGKLKKFRLYDGDILIAMTGQGSVGRVGRLYISEDETPYLNQRVGKFSADEITLNKDFLYYVISSKGYENYLFAAGSGSGQPNLSPALIKSVEIPYPPYDMQCRIGKVLKDLDDKIELNTQINKTLEQIAQALFISWFVDFDPVKAKIETLATGGSADDAELAAMRVISAKSIDELNSLKVRNTEAFNKLAQTAALFPAAMQDSEFGEIPEGWIVDQLGDHLNVLQTGSRPKGGVGGITEGVPSVGAENILGVGNYTYGKEKFVSREFFDKLKRGVIEDFDFLLYKDGGKPGEFKPRVSMFGCGFPYSEFAINEHVFRMRSESLGQAFLYFQIGHKRVLDELANRGGKAAIPGINQTDVKTIPVLVPSAAELLTEFNDFAQKIIESILKKSNESNHLVAVRDTLLPKLLSGEIDLSNEVVA